jgi:hypothetical protein
MICNNPNHDVNCRYHNNNNNSLKGASAVNNNKLPTKQLLVFNQSELNLVSKTLEVLKYFVGKNQSQFQQPEDILNEISTSIYIINSRQNKNKSNLKGASSNNICNETKMQSLKNIKKMFNLT